MAVGDEDRLLEVFLEGLDFGGGEQNLFFLGEGLLLLILEIVEFLHVLLAGQLLGLNHLGEFLRPLVEGLQLGAVLEQVFLPN